MITTYNIGDVVRPEGSLEDFEVLANVVSYPLGENPHQVLLRSQRDGGMAFVKRTDLLRNFSLRKAIGGMDEAIKKECLIRAAGPGPDNKFYLAGPISGMDREAYLIYPHMRFTTLEDAQAAAVCANVAILFGQERYRERLRRLL